jgi:hypothetical protein
MKRLLFPAFIGLSVATGILTVAACDPDLGITKVPGEGGAESETGATDAPVTPPDEEAGPPAEGGTQEAGPDAAVEHKIDGTNDFASGDKFPTTSPLYDGYVSWDDKKVYFGMQGADVAGGSSSKWVLIYVDGNPGNAGSTSGISYDCSMSCTAQKATLPFAAGYHLRWKTDNTYTNLQKWNGSAWSDVGPISTVARSGTFMEISITRLALGSPAKLKVHMNMLIEKTGEEWTYAGVPSTSFTDGKNPATFSKFYEFDLADTTKAPNTYPLKP